MGINPGGRTNGHVSVALAHPSSNGGETPVVRLEVTDRASRIVVLQVELDAEQFLNLMANRTAYGPASWTNHTGRIGKVMQHDNYALPSETFKDKEAAQLGAEVWGQENGWEYVDARRNNGGQWVFTGRRWVDPEPGTAPTGFLYDDPQ